MCGLSDDGRLHKAININNKMYIIEEMVIFPDGQPVQHIELDSDKVGAIGFNGSSYDYIMVTAPLRGAAKLSLKGSWIQSSLLLLCCLTLY